MLKPRRKITKTRFSTNTIRLNELYNNRNYMLKIIDNSNDGLSKRVFIYIPDIEAGFGDVSSLWKEFQFNSKDKTAEFDFYGDNILKATINSFELPAIKVSNGNVYSTNEDSNLITRTDSISGSRFKIENNDPAYEMHVILIRHGKILKEATIASSGSTSVNFKKSFYIYATNDFENYPEISDFNTEISVLGINRANLIMIKVSDEYTFSLSDVISS